MKADPLISSIAHALHELVELKKAEFEWLKSHESAATRQDLERILHKIMIAQATLDASLAALTAAAANITAAVAAGNTATATPDTVVAAYQGGVDAITVALAAATPPVATPTPAAAK